MVVVKVSNLAIVRQFERCKAGSTFFVMIGPVWKTHLPPQKTWRTDKIFVRVSRIAHTRHDLTFTVLLLRKDKPPAERYLNFDIGKGIWTYGKDENHWDYLQKKFPGKSVPECWRADPRVVADIKIVHCEKS